MKELKPCPFCRGKAVLYVNDGVKAVCVECGCQSETYVDGFNYAYGDGSIEGAISAWNRRVE